MVVDPRERHQKWGEQDEYGNDIGLLRYNLSLTDEQKLAQLQRAIRFMKECMLAADRAGVHRPTEST